MSTFHNEFSDRGVKPKKLTYVAASNDMQLCIKLRPQTATEELKNKLLFCTVTHKIRTNLEVYIYICTSLSCVANGVVAYYREGGWEIGEGGRLNFFPSKGRGVEVFPRHQEVHIICLGLAGRGGGGGHVSHVVRGGIEPFCSLREGG